MAQFKITECQWNFCFEDPCTTNRRAGLRYSISLLWHVTSSASKLGVYWLPHQVTALITSCHHRRATQGQRAAAEGRRGTTGETTGGTKVEFISTRTSVLIVRAEPGKCSCQHTHTHTALPVKTLSHPAAPEKATSSVFTTHPSLLNVRLTAEPDSPLNPTDEQLMAPLCVVWCW